VTVVVLAFETGLRRPGEQGARVVPAKRRASRSSHRAAIALSNRVDSVQANPSPIQFLMPWPNGKNVARISLLL
jgi:hypothetical protein